MPGRIEEQVCSKFLTNYFFNRYVYHNCLFVTGWSEEESASNIEEFSFDLVILLVMGKI